MSENVSAILATYSLLDIVESLAGGQVSSGDLGAGRDGDNVGAVYHLAWVVAEHSELLEGSGERALDLSLVVYRGHCISLHSEKNACM